MQRNVLLISNAFAQYDQPPLLLAWCEDRTGS